MDSRSWHTHQLGLCLLAAATRAPFLFQRWWADERITAAFVREYGVLGLLVDLPARQPHFPPYYLLLEAWTHVADIHLARVLAFGFGILAVLATAELGRQWVDESTGAWAGLCIVFAPSVVVPAGWLRMYALLACLAIASWWALERAVARDDCRGWAGWVAVAIATCWVHPYGLVLVGVQSVRLTTSRPWWPRLAIAVATAPAVGLLLAKVAASMGLLSRTAVGTASLGHLSTPPTAADVWFLPAALLVGRIHLLAQFAIGPVLPGLLATVGWRFRDEVVIRRLGWWLVGPVVVVVGLSYVEPIWELKYLAPLLTPPLGLLLGYAIAHTRSRLRLPAVAALLTIQVGVLVVRGGTAPWIALRVF